MTLQVVTGLANVLLRAGQHNSNGAIVTTIHTVGSSHCLPQIHLAQDEVYHRLVNNRDPLSLTKLSECVC